MIESNQLETESRQMLKRILPRVEHTLDEHLWADLAKQGDEDAAILGVNGYDHRRFLNEFYRGLPFQENFATGG